MNGKPVFDDKTVRSEEKLVLDDRKKLYFKGLSDVVSFDENGALFKTSSGVLVLDGEDLHVTKLDIDGGTVEVEGRIGGIIFSDNDGKGRKKRLSK